MIKLLQRIIAPQKAVAPQDQPQLNVWNYYRFVRYHGLETSFFVPANGDSSSGWQEGDVPPKDKILVTADGEKLGYKGACIRTGDTFMAIVSSAGEKQPVHIFQGLNDVYQGRNSYSLTLSTTGSVVQRSDSNLYTIITKPHGLAKPVHVLAAIRTHKGPYWK